PSDARLHFMSQIINRHDFTFEKISKIFNTGTLHERLGWIWPCPSNAGRDLRLAAWSASCSEKDASHRAVLCRRLFVWGWPLDGKIRPRPGPDRHRAMLFRRDAFPSK